MKPQLRKFPYPYRAALNICSDIDGTDTAEKFLAIQTFLNTDRDTDYGPGINLEIGNTFFPMTPDDAFSYLSSRPSDRALIRDFIKAGYIDCIHSYGNNALARADALRTLEALEQDGCKLQVWIDHEHVPNNFGPDNSNGEGDVPTSPVYHADATLAHGIKFAWMGRATSLVGQDIPMSFKAWRHIYEPQQPRASLENLYREFVKVTLAQMGSKRFAIHKGNPQLKLTHLRDGQPVYEFNRCNNHWHKREPNSLKLAYMLRPAALNLLKEVGGYMVIYTHLGYVDPPVFVPPETQAALRGLAAEYHSGQIYVATTYRMLTYNLMYHYLDWAYELGDDEQVTITITGVSEPLTGPRVPTLEELQGITFYVPKADKATLVLGQTPITALDRNPKDDTGQESITIPREPLIYPV